MHVKKYRYIYKYIYMMMMGPNSLVLEGGASLGERGRGGMMKEGRTDRNSDARCERSCRSNSVRGAECEEQEKT